MTLRFASFCILISVACARVAAAECDFTVLAALPVTMSATQPIITATLNGQDVHLLADSGAFFSSLTALAADRLKLKPNPHARRLSVRGMGGNAAAVLVQVQDFELQGMRGTAHGVDFLVVGNLQLGQADGVLGANFLGVSDTEYDLANGVIRIVRTKDCANRRLDYWNQTPNFGLIDIQSWTPQHPHIVGDVVLNGLKIRALFDTGSSTSLLSRRVAEKVGIRPDSPGVVAVGAVKGVGERRVEAWIGTFNSLDLGGETIRNIKIRFGELGNVEGEDLLLGADFFLSHRIYVAKSQNKLYFSYNGGPVFDLKVRTEAAPAKVEARDVLPPSPSSETPGVAAAAVTSTDFSDTPNDAAGYRRRGAAAEARGDLAGAASDFDHAIGLDPEDADSFYLRALLRLRTRAMAPAMQDLDEAIRLRPNANSLLVRGELRVASNDPSGAEADFNAAVELTPTDDILTLKVTNLEVNAARYDEAIARLDRWVDTHSGSHLMPVALNGRCWARAAQGAELKLALADCDSAVRSAPRVANFLSTRAVVRLRLGDLDGAMKDYKASLGVDPKLASALYGRGLVELKKGHKEEAARDMQAAVNLSPKIADLYKKLGLIS